MTMRAKGNTTLSDNELRRIMAILTVSEHPLEALQEAFPSIKINMTDNVIWFGNPPWDLTQEIEV